MAKIYLKKGKDKPVRRGHPWVYSGAVARNEGDLDSPLALVHSASGEPLGWGFHHPSTRIRVRVLHHGAGEPQVDSSFFEARLKAAARLREELVDEETTGYRLVNAEGDRLPGWTVDRFGDVLVSQVTSRGLERLREPAYAALRRLWPEMAILQQNALPARRAEGLTPRDEEVHGPVPPEVSFREAGLTFMAEIVGGQKTGFYCDQRENRRLAGRLAAGRTVLDLFAHSGAFGVHAARGGAERVVHVESAPRLIERGQRHYEVNREHWPHREPAVEWVKADVFTDLRERRESYGLVVCDPPPLARRGSRDAAARAYKDLNRLAFSRLEPGGLLLTFSCSGAIDAKLFRQILFSAADEAKVDAALLRPLSAAPDHPVALSHPEGEYLKGWLLRRVG